MRQFPWISPGLAAEGLSREEIAVRMSLWKDCQCIGHEGPHWLYEDFLDRERNLAYLERFVRAVEVRNADEFAMSWEAWRRAEQMRLCEKIGNMREGVEYGYALLGIDSRVDKMEQRRRDLLTRLKRATIAYEQAHKDKRVLCQAKKKEKADERRNSHLSSERLATGDQ